MTVCIAGISESGKIIAITDKMLTTTTPTATKYEISSNKKAIRLTDKSVALFAGEVIHANEILSAAKKKLAASPSQTVEGAANAVVEAYREYVTRLINDHLFSKFGIDRAVFMANHKNLDPDFVKNTNKVISEYNLQVQIIVAGVDTQPHVFSVTSPGVMYTNDSVGYACVGSGSQHASLSLIESSYHGGINEGEALHALLEAKKRAEFDPGVGSLCDIVLINSEYKEIPEATITKMLTAYDTSVSTIKGLEQKCAVELEKVAYDK